MKIQIFACGGTIDKVYFDAKSEFQVGEPQIATVLRESNVTFEYQIESLLRKDSLDMTDEDRALIKKKVTGCKSNKILITHGTDTMIKTALNLKDIKDKTIVLTGSMAPAKFHITDAYFNIGSAVAALHALEAGTYIVINGQIFDPAKCKKNVASGRFEAV